MDKQHDHCNLHTEFFYDCGHCQAAKAAHDAMRDRQKAKPKEDEYSEEGATE
jgi:hypothetical protein